jgi:DNA-binding response OmpR family regulator
MNRILLIEDHARLAALIRHALDKAGIGVDAFQALEPAWSASRQMPYGAMVVDRGLPDGDGLAFVQRCRAAGVHTPCLILTARDALHDRVEGLDGGADDYLTKPFEMEELVARVRALLRRPTGQHTLTPGHGDIQLRPGEGVMCCGEECITLPAAEMQLMLELVGGGGHVVRRTLLESAAWGLADSVTPNALDVALHRIRRKLLAIGSVQSIVNVRGIGYAFRDDDPAR